MRSKSRAAFTFVGLLVATSIIGSGGSFCIAGTTGSVSFTDDQPDATPCAGVKKSATGKVTLDGKPLSGATVTFVFRERKRKVTDLIAITNAKGEFKLCKIKERKRPLPGQYMVKITKSVQTKTGKTPMVPARYNTRTSLVTEITKDGANRFVFELKSR